MGEEADKGNGVVEGGDVGERGVVTIVGEVGGGEGCGEEKGKGRFAIEGF